MIYITGDLHGTAEYGRNRLSARCWPQGRDLSRDEIVIVAGDFGYVWDGSRIDAYWLKWLEEKPWTTCFVDGNHENHALLGSLPERMWNGGRVHEVMPHVLHLMRGQVFDIDGLSIFTMGGASSHDREWRTEGESWWPEELPSDAERTESLPALGHAWGEGVVTAEPTASAEGVRTFTCGRCGVTRAESIARLEQETPTSNGGKTEGRGRQPPSHGRPGIRARAPYRLRRGGRRLWRGVAPQEVAGVVFACNMIQSPS